MAKQKNTELNFLYLDEKYQDKKKKANKEKVKTTKQKPKKKKTRADQMSASSKEETFNFDNEIVIGVTKISKEDAKNNEKKQKTNTKKKNSKNNNLKNSKKKRTNTSNKNVSNNKKKKTKQNKKDILVRGIIKWTILLGALMASIIMFMMSPLFNLVEIQVTNNEKISSDTIISLSQLKVGENIYKTSKKKIENNIKQNAYIESVKIQRTLPNKINITVNERIATYMLEYAGSYAYINNQGYILEISQDKIECPIIMGYTTKEDEIKVGNRLNDEDLEKIAVVLKIVESANANEIGNLITKINIQDKQNYTLILEGQDKTVYLGDASNLSTRIPHLKVILQEEEGVSGEIFINGDLNKQKAFFRKKE